MAEQLPSGAVLVISPHLDDAVLSCGDLLLSRPGSVALTLFAGRPPAGPLTEWDAAAGFVEGDDVIGARRAEDAAALRLLGARPVWLDFLDAQYGPSPEPTTVAQAIEEVIAKLGCSRVCLPLGLFHSDHILAHRAGRKLMRRREGIAWRAYADVPYSGRADLVEERLAELRGDGIGAEEVPRALGSASARKREAVMAYASQLRALTSVGRPGYQGAFAPERYWLLSPAVGR